jgi:hypothetical protein
MDPDIALQLDGALRPWLELKVFAVAGQRRVVDLPLMIFNVEIGRRV